MRKFLPLFVIGIVAAIAHQRANRDAPREDSGGQEISAVPAVPPDLQVERPTSEPQNFSCNGRTRCPEMTSCEEAMYFLQNCPGVKMDGDRDGIPCEDQWCAHLR